MLTFVLSVAGAVSVDPTKIEDGMLSTICTIFSVLAGLILAIYALHISSIESINGMPKSTHKAIVWDSRKAILRLSYFFWIYLLTLTLALAVIVFKSLAVEVATEVTNCFAKITVFFSILAMGVSFLIPLELKYIQERKVLEAKERIDS